MTSIAALDRMKAQLSSALTKSDSHQWTALGVSMPHIPRFSQTFAVHLIDPGYDLSLSIPVLTGKL